MDNYKKFLFTLIVSSVIVYGSVMIYCWTRNVKDNAIEKQKSSKIKLIESVNIGAYHYEIVKIDSSEFLVNSQGLVKIK